MLIGFEHLFAIDLKAKMIYFHVSILINTFEKLYLVCLPYMHYTDTDTLLQPWGEDECEGCRKLRKENKTYSDKLIVAEEQVSKCYTRHPAPWSKLGKLNLAEIGRAHV